MSIAELERKSVDRERVESDLQATLEELIALMLQGKQAHWNVAGPLFKPVHEQLDGIVDIARDAADEIAERIATLGGHPDGRVSTVAAAQPLVEIPGGALTTVQAVGVLADDLERIIGHLEVRIRALAEADPVSQGLLIEAAGQLAKQSWMLRKQLD
jgi:starvation-inducible DNA-binding protein